MVCCTMKGVAAAALASLLVAGCVARRPAPVSERTPPPAVAPAPPAVAVRPATPPGAPAERPATTTAPLKSAPAQVEARPLGPGAPSTVPPTVTPPPGGNVKVEPLAVHVPYSDQAYGQLASIRPQPAVEPKPPARPELERGEDDLEWIWPASGRVISGFNEGANLKGIAIAGKLGQPVLASAPGRVIFSGTGIRGFGKLIVIKHNNTFLSVYAHNHTLLVKEGQTVSKGQKIAEMGSTDTDQVKLHFEIRRFGKPVDPGKLLPDRPA